MRLKHTLRLVLGLAVAAAIAAGAQMQLAGSPSATPRTPAATVGTPEYTIELPEGWTTQGSRDDGIGRIDSYVDGTGNYFRVLVFDATKPFGSGYAADATWQLTLTNGRYTVAKKGGVCKPDPVLAPDCTAGNGGLEIYAMAGNGDGAVKGHVFQFEFGNDRTETADTAVFEGILESFRVK